MKTNGTLPMQLQSDNFGFVKLLKKSKKPFEKDWQNKPYTYKEIQKWIEQCGNYGVLGGCGGLTMLDADTDEIVNIVRDRLPATFTVRTPGRCKYHYYYICKDIKNTVRLDVGDKHYGDIISSGAQVVGPGSIHPDTGTEYQVVNDIKIAEINKEDIFTNLIDYIPSEFPNKDAFDDLTEKYGQPYYLTDKGALSGINEAFWAGLHDTEHIQLYEPDEKYFYQYDDSTGLYKEISIDLIKQEISKRMLGVSRENNINELERKRGNAALNNVVGHLKGICEKKDVFNKNERKIIHLANGVIEFKTSDEADFVVFSPKFYSRNQSPIPFNESAQCPRFLNELLYPATTPDDAILLQKYTGLCLLGNNLIQRLLILDGGAGLGKSTVSSTIQKTVGLNNVTELRTRHLAGRFELYRYLKKTLLVGVDVPGNFLSQKGAQVLKGLVGGDGFDAEQKIGTGSFQLQGNYCTLITSNSRLHVKLDGDIGAWGRRVLIIRFKGDPPEKKIPGFADLLIEKEGSGILNWALHGLNLLLEDIRIHGDIQLTKAQIDIVGALLAESDSLRHFLNDCVVSDMVEDLSVQEIIESYAEYCPTKSWYPKPLTIVHKELNELMLEIFKTTKSHSIKRDGRSVRGFRGVSLR